MVIRINWVKKIYKLDDGKNYIERENQMKMSNGDSAEWKLD